MLNTPVQVVIQGVNNIYFKREDLIPFSFGGNKARKARYFFREMDGLGSDCVVTYGSSSSNHCRVVANMAASRNLPCYIIGPQEASEPTFNSLMMGIFKAEIKTVPVSEVHDTIENTLERLRSQGKTPYFIEGGGHGNWGTQAYVDCYNEISQYENDNSIHFDYIFFASGTGTTQAGLVCGQLLHGDERQIIGISIARKNPRGRNVVIDSIRSYLKARNIETADEAISKSVIFLDDYTGEGYASSNDKVDSLISQILIEKGIPLDSTYTGKAFAGMMAEIEKRDIIGKNILFIHTGGTPLFFDYLRKSRN